jgi:hypothetical protein
MDGTEDGASRLERRFARRMFYDATITVLSKFVESLGLSILPSTIGRGDLLY